MIAIQKYCFKWSKIIKKLFYAKKNKTNDQYYESSFFFNSIKYFDFTLGDI